MVSGIEVPSSPLLRDEVSGGEVDPALFAADLGAAVRKTRNRGRPLRSVHGRSQLLDVGNP